MIYAVTCLQYLQTTSAFEFNRRCTYGIRSIPDGKYLQNLEIFVNQHVREISTKIVY